MPQFRTLEHPMIGLIAWDPDRPATWVNDHIAMVNATSNAYLIVGDDGDVLVNATNGAQAPGARKKFEALIGRPLNISKIIFTQSHPDHIGGWQEFMGPDTEIIVQRAFKQICNERKLLGEFFARRNYRVLSALLTADNPNNAWFEVPDPEPLTTFADEYEFTCSGRRYQLLTMSSGETLDALAVWMPDEKTVFIGNWAGALYDALPNFYTARGDRQRSVVQWLADCEKLIALGAETLITGHGDPIEGADRVRKDLQKLHDVVTYIHDETVKGMNAQKTLPQIMGELKLPDRFQMAPGRGPAHWYARAVWEEYAGWFKHEQTSELYPTPASAIWPELVELAGGAEVLAEKARKHLDAGDPERALHFVEMAVSAEPDNAAAREAELATYEVLADRTGGKVFDELGWLEGKITQAKAALDKA